MHKLLPPQYSWLMGVPWPPMLGVAINEFGLVEGEGDANNPIILGWAREAAEAGAGAWLEAFYVQDSVPWCGLFMAMCAARAGYGVQPDCLSARGWMDWGDKTVEPGLGDVLVFWRGRPDGSNGHVGLYIGEDADCFHVLGGNQGDAVSIVRIAKSRLLGARRWPGGPKAPMVPLAAAGGAISENEA